MYIDIIITTRNRLPLLARAIRSVLNQSYPFRKIIVVNDRSTDGTGAWLRDLSCEEIVSFNMEQQCGPSSCRNLALAHSQAPVVAFLDDDDEYLPHHLSWIAEAYRRDRATPMTLAAFKEMEPGDRIIHRRFDYADMTAPELAMMIVLRLFITCTSQISVRRDVAERIGGFAPKMTRYEDHDFVLKALAHGLPQFSTEPSWIKHYDPGSLSRKQEDRLPDFLKLVARHPQLYRNLYADYTDAWLYRHLESEGIRSGSMRWFEALAQIQIKCPGWWPNAERWENHQRLDHWYHRYRQSNNSLEMVKAESARRGPVELQCAS